MAQFDNVKTILTDIEGTTSSISFVKDVLFPYAADHLATFVQQHQHQPEVQQQLQATAALVAAEGQPLTPDDLDAVIGCLLRWIEQDTKATPLKALQGMIWKQGYEQGDYQAHMYPDATEQLKHWHSQGLPLYVYSSGSVQAQQLFFGYSQDGDLLPLFTGHFDTMVGAKQEPRSYQNIVAQLQASHDIEAGNVLFLSDIEQELDAAAEAGLQTCWLLREQPFPEFTSHPAVASFAAIQLS